MWHVVPGASGEEIRESYAILKAANIPFGVKVVNEPGLCTSAVTSGGICISRTVSPSDCPNMYAASPEQEALRWLNAIAPHVSMNATYIEVTNECGYFELTKLQWWNSFFLEFIRLANNAGWPPLVLPSLSPGTPPDFWMLEPYKPALEALRDSGGLFGTHDYSIDEPGDLCNGSSWLAYRHKRIYAKLVEMGLGDLHIAITEAARDWGASTPDEQDFACWYANVARNDPYVVSVALWTGGITNYWYNARLEGHYVNIAQLVVQQSRSIPMLWWIVGRN